MAVALALQLCIGLGEIAASMASHSISLLADAGHNLIDAAGIGLAIFAVLWATAPGNERRSFGNHRATILAALANAAATAAVTVGIVVESIIRLMHPQHVDGLVVTVTATLSFVFNGLSALVIHEKSPDLNMKTSFFHIAADMLSSLAVVAAGVVLMIDPSFMQIDAIAPFVVATFILYLAYSLLKESVVVLMESTPAYITPHELIDSMESIEGIDEVHDLHIWSLSSEFHVLSAHLVVVGHPTLEDAQAVAEKVREALRASYGIAHATLELECEHCIQSDSIHMPAANLASDDLKG
ncbi:MAG: cation diffusion facilitator family transporter [Acidimicrobiales bacterium]